MRERGLNGGPLHKGQKSENPLFRARRRLIECENRVPSFRQWGTTRSTRFTMGNRRGEREREREGAEGGKKKVARRGATWSNFHQGKCRFHRVVRVTSNLRVTWNRFPDAMSVARSLHEQTRERGGETHAPMHLTCE